jgi:hypothetical protein
MMQVWRDRKEAEMGSEEGRSVMLVYTHQHSLERGRGYLNSLFSPVQRDEDLGDTTDITCCQLR